MWPDISIILVNWNTRDLLLDCLASLPAAVGHLHAQVWVVDNASSDDSVAAVRARFPRVQVIQNERNVGFAPANNQAIRASAGRYVLLLNSDTIALPGALAALVNFLDSHPEAGIVGPRLLNGDGSLQPSWAAFPTIWSELLGKNVRTYRAYPTHDRGMTYAVDWVGGACMLIRRAVIDQVGLLDEQFFMYSEETDWCFRVKQQGWEICYYPEAQVIHLGGQSSKKASTRMKAELYRSKLLFFRKHYGARRTVLLARLLQAKLLSKAGGAWLLARLRRSRSSDAQALCDDSMALVGALHQQLGVRPPQPDGNA